MILLELSIQCLDSFILELIYGIDWIIQGLRIPTFKNEIDGLDRVLRRIGNIFQPCNGGSLVSVMKGNSLN